ncbi:MAG: alpha/beta fold hydrolase [Pseudomonadota bacterium]
MLATLNFEAQTATDMPPLVIAHGLFGSGRNWGVIAKRMSDTRHVVTVDMRNHGSSPWDADHSYAALAADLAEVISSLGTCDLLGHSMGGKAAMVAALSGAAVRRLIVGDIAPVGYTHTQIHLIDAMEALDLSTIASRSDADAALAGQIDDPTVRAFLLQSLDVPGKMWKLNLPALRDQMPAILGFPPVNATFDGATLFLSGALSDYVLPEARAAIKPLFSKARFAKIPAAGHWLHAEKPREFEAAIRVFLDS